jgi:hypothetical protein
MQYSGGEIITVMKSIRTVSVATIQAVSGKCRNVEGNFHKQNVAVFNDLAHHARRSGVAVAIFLIVFSEFIRNYWDCPR